ncbi:hypothetical protein LTR09_007653 [Extremus antarcticus]|uniref:Uncharacterized protein n=1 Tax=Extremus antarcticus TaxID=702011 RepID=A0AAJ0DCC8_9PEZI|nr:hypothetical protein LTR09_007653 [Extremus antarcticus]
MPIFAPVYRSTTKQQSFLTRQQKALDKKRKRGEEGSDDEQASNGSAPETYTRPYHAISTKDPYHIAGISREQPFPPAPFPHAAIKAPSKPKPSIDDELAALNPPLYLPPAQGEEKTSSSRRRHLDNLTTILHRSLLRNDWPRASRAWSILIRTESNGHAIDIRRHGRWGIGAELLMRRGGSDSQGESPFSDDGFKLARQYYERLILQYPHTAQSQYYAQNRDSINATAVYPTLFNIWVFEVQDRSKRARKEVSSNIVDSAASVSEIWSELFEDQVQLRKIRSLELEQALPIAQRMDELLLSPPYDTNTTLLELRGMVALWISDLHKALADLPSDDMDASFGSEATSPVTAMHPEEHHRAESGRERQKAEDTFAKLASSGADLHPRVSKITDDLNTIVVAHR